MNQKGRLAFGDGPRFLGSLSYYTYSGPIP